MEISAKMVKELRDKTGAGMMDAKKALQENDGNLEKAAEWLREKGIQTAAKKADRIASEGIIETYVHGGRIGVMVEINSETDFVAKNEEFQKFAKDIAMHVAASNPKYLTREEVPAEEIEKEKSILTEQAKNEGKPDHIIEKMVEGRMDKFYEEIVLMDQAFIRDTDITISQLLTNLVAKIGENIKIRRFVRYELGEGLEKRSENFADEVAKQISL